MTTQATPLPLPATMSKTPTLRQPYVYKPKLRRPYSEVPRGYSAAAAYVDAHEDAAVFRRFGVLKARVLLCMQAEIEEKEMELEEIDDEEQYNHINKPSIPDNCGWIGHKNRRRKELIKEIGDMLRQYESDLLQYREMRSLPKPRQWQIENFDRLLKESQPIKKTEYKFLEDPEDLVSTYPSDPDQAHFLEPVERAYHAFIKFIGRAMPSSKSATFIDKSQFIQYSKTGTRAFSRVLFGILVAGVIASGVLAIYHCETDATRLIALSFSTLTLTLFTSVFTTAKKSEVFGVAAAYCAVLVVFVGSVLEKDTSVIELSLGNTRINGTIFPM